MEAISATIANSSLSFPSHRPFGRPHLPSKPRAVRFRPASAKRKDGHGSDFGGGLVDQDMVVLRKRIHDMEVAERNYEPPSHWAKWEKRYYAKHGSNVCGFGTDIVDEHPTRLTIGLAGLMAMSVPTSAVLICHFSLRL